jgi:hypothetical protein
MLSGAKRAELSRSSDNGSVTCKERRREGTPESVQRVEGDVDAWDGKCARVSDGQMRLTPRRGENCPDQLSPQRYRLEGIGQCLSL